MSTSGSTIPASQPIYKLDIKILSATLSRDTDLAGKMDPYVVLEFA